MDAPSQIDSVTIEIHRLGGESGLIRQGERYIVLTGGNAPACEQTMGLGHEDFLGKLNCLRYLRIVTGEQAAEALASLGRHAAGFLPSLPPPERVTQIDLVMGAAELWAFPFEACCIDGVRVFADPASHLILTRRIRQGFAGHKRAWPVRPRVLFAYAPEAADLPGALIQSHRDALQEALVPWSATGDPERDGLLQAELVLGEGDLKRVIDAAHAAQKPFTHIHVLAHGKPIVDPLTKAQRWGLRLGDQRRSATEPDRLAEVLGPRDGVPIVVTVASCDSGNQAETTIPKRSFAQELHKAGVPVVLASQLPLTQAGSVVMTRTCYRLLLVGDDARWALHQARQALAASDEAGHDWMSLVGYVQLPEGYADQLLEVGLVREMALLRALRRRFDAMSVEDAETLDLKQMQRELQERIGAVERRLKDIPRHRADLRDECQGILASAHKRLAELLFWRAARAVDAAEQARDEAASRMSLEASLASYRAAFHTNIHHHWCGAQQLALEAALHGAFADGRDWDTVLRAAELHIANSAKEYWAYGTLAELWLLAPLAGRPRDLERAKKALDRLKTAPDPEAVPATRDQLDRYVSWWTTGNGFFGGRADLAADARDLLDHLIQPATSEG